MASPSTRTSFGEDAHHRVVLQEVGELVVVEEVVDRRRPRRPSGRERMRKTVRPMRPKPLMPTRSSCGGPSARRRRAPRSARGGRRRGGRSPSPRRTRRASWRRSSPSTIVASESRRGGRAAWSDVGRDDGLGLVVHDVPPRLSPTAVRMTSLIAVTVTVFSCQQTRSTTEPFGTGTFMAQRRRPFPRARAAAPATIPASAIPAG